MKTTPMPPSPICFEQLVRADDRAGPFGAIALDVAGRGRAGDRAAIEEAAGRSWARSRLLDLGAQFRRRRRRPVQEGGALAGTLLERGREDRSA